MFRTSREGLTWAKFKTVFRNRYKDVHTDQYHYMKLQTSRQSKGEDPQAFADKCRELAGKIICKVEDPLAQRIHNENSERMLLASFLTGLTGNPGTQCRYANPQSMDQALKIALYRRQRGKKKLVRVFMQTLIGRLG